MCMYGYRNAWHDIVMDDVLVTRPDNALARSHSISLRLHKQGLISYWLSGPASITVRPDEFPPPSDF